MSYYESAEGYRLTDAQTHRELSRHGLASLTPEEAADLDRLAPRDRDGHRDAQAVLAWLGH